MIHKSCWLIILVLGIFNLALADTVGPIRSMSPNPVGHNSDVNSVAFSPDRDYVYSGHDDKTLKVWNSGLSLVNHGTYRITFTVRDDDGATASKTQAITVNDKQITAYSLESKYGTITIDGGLSDWKANERINIPLDRPPYLALDLILYGKYVNTPEPAYVIALKSTKVTIGNNTTFWLNIDKDAKTGYQLWDQYGGAEYYVNVIDDPNNPENKNQPHLYNNKFEWKGSLTHAYNADRSVIEFVIPIASMPSASAIEQVGMLIDINDKLFVFPGNYPSGGQFTIVNVPNKSTVNDKQIPPTAKLQVIPLSGDAPLQVTLNGSQSSDKDGNIVKYQWTSSDGQSADGVQTSLTFSQVGTHNITLTVTDNEGATASSSQGVTVNEKPSSTPTSSPVEGVGQAIIIAAGGSNNNTLYKITNEYTQRFYRLLKERGFKDENIAYMNPQPPDLDLDLRFEQQFLDYQLFDPESEFKEAFQQAANKLTAGQQFIFFLHGHASPNSFRIMDNYELSATYLRDLLALLPANTQQILILDSCYSGSFFDELMASNRILISSADDKNLAWNTEYESFTDTFLRSLRSGMSLTESFQQTKELILSDKQLFGEQNPWLDDDGNGIYNSGDGRRAEKIQLGKQGIHAAPPPTIHEIHRPIVLEENMTEANLWVRTTPGVDGIHKVRAILINPQFSSGEYKGLETNFGREELELIYNPVRERYGAFYQGFKTPGIWRILYQAQSKQGIWSDIVQGEVQAKGSSKIATIKIAPNISSYKSTEPVNLYLDVNGQTEADLYVAIILPDKSFITFGYPSNPSWPNKAELYQTIKIAGPKNYRVNINLPADAELGQYSTCGVLVKAETAPLEMGNWIDFHCAEFEVY